MRRFFFCNFVAVGLRAWTTFPSIASEVTAFLKRSNNSCKSDLNPPVNPILNCPFEYLHALDYLLSLAGVLEDCDPGALLLLVGLHRWVLVRFCILMGPRFNSSMNTKVGQSSSLSPSRRSRSPQSVESQPMQISTKRAIGASQEKRRGSESEEVPYHICIPTNGSVKLNKPLFVSNREKRKERERPVGQYLRPGMVLLQKCLGLMDQVEIVNKCYELGIGSAGFYRPGYRDGAKLHLQMMCLGKDWNPESRLYDKSRSFDGAVTPEIPEEFSKLVDRALNKSHEFLREHGKKVEEIPNMSPDICIVNFYSNSGKLGLHQDRDESEESLNKGLPVVSFSIGDSAEFLYSDERDVDKAEKVMLESGDVLIFGGHARHIFHGVSSIKPKTGPEILIDETTKLRPGRLNLTFRQY